MKKLILILGLAMVAGIVLSAPTTTKPSVILGWDRTTQPEVNGYRVYWGSVSRNYTNSISVAGAATTSCVITNLERGVTYYFAATCTATNSLESDYSLEATYTTLRLPNPPINVTVTVGSP